MSQPHVIEGQIWRHCKGNAYLIVAVAEHVDRGVDEVVYRELARPGRVPHPKPWIRDLDEFLSPHSSGIERFTLVHDPTRSSPG